MATQNLRRVAPLMRTSVPALIASAFLALTGCAVDSVDSELEDVAEQSQAAVVGCSGAAAAAKTPEQVEGWVTKCGTATATGTNKIAMSWAGTMPNQTSADVFVDACPPEYQARCVGASCRCEWKSGHAPVVVQLAARDATTYARDSDGNVWGWGSSDNSAIPGASGDVTVPRLIDVRAAAIAASNQQTCVITSPGREVLCWGVIVPAIGGRPAVEWSVPTRVEGVIAARSVSIGKEHACAETWFNEVYCWGRGEEGQLGDRLPDYHKVCVNEDGEVVDADADVEKTCFDEPVQYSDRSKSTAVRVTGLMANSVVASGNASCALVADRGGAVYCWGDAREGGLGTGSLAGYHGTPIGLADDGRTPFGGNVPRSLRGGGGLFCADTNAAAGQEANGPRRYCWGLNTNGQTGNSPVGHPFDPSPVSQANLGVQKILPALWAGPGNACHSSTSGASLLQCWGSNQDQRITLAKLAETPAAQTIADVPATSVAIGSGHFCTLGERNRIKCWGNNSHGQVGAAAGVTSTKVGASVDISLWDRWPDGIVPICLKDGNSADGAAPASAIAVALRRRILAAWPTVANIDFQGFGKCEGDLSGKLVVTVDNSDGASSSCFGYQRSAPCNIRMGTAHPRYQSSLVAELLGRALGLTAAEYQWWYADPQGDADIAMHPWQVIDARRMYGSRLPSVVQLRRTEAISFQGTNRTYGKSSEIGADSSYAYPEGWLLTEQLPGTVPIYTQYASQFASYKLTTSPASMPYEQKALEGYVYPNAAPDGETIADLVPLKTYSKGTQFITSSTLGPEDLPAGFSYLRTEGYVFRNVPYTLLTRYRHSQNSDDFLASLNGATSKSVESAGYRIVSLDSAVLKHDLPGTSKLQVRYDANALDYLTVKRDTLTRGSAVSVEGYVLDAATTSSRRLALYSSPSKSDYVTVASPQSVPAGDYARITPLVGHGYALSLARYKIGATYASPQAPNTANALQSIWGLNVNADAFCRGQGHARKYSITNQCLDAHTYVTWDEATERWLATAPSSPGCVDIATSITCL